MYLECLKALAYSESLKPADWPFAKPTNNEIIECFISKSQWYVWKKLFTRLPEFPEMQKWLLEEDDAYSEVEVWGTMEQKTLALLEEWINCGGKIKNKEAKDKKKTTKKAASKLKK